MKYIIKYKGGEAADLKKVLELIGPHQGTVIDGDNLPSIALIKIPTGELEFVKENLDGYQIFPEKEYEIPTTRKSVKKKL